MKKTIRFVLVLGCCFVLLNSNFSNRLQAQSTRKSAESQTERTKLPEVETEEQVEAKKSAAVDDQASEKKTEPTKPETAAEKPADEKKIETLTAETKPLIAYESFNGVFESTKMHEVKTDFENWTDLVIDSAVEEGTAVSTGDVLLKFDSESIDKAVREAEFAVRSAEFELKTAELEMKQADQTFELEKSLAERAWQTAQEDQQYYLQTELPQQMDDLDYSEKTAGYYLEYSKDELDQLEQMYNEDELTEESEAIVLKRAQRDVESAQRSMDRTLVRLKRQRDTSIPREKIQREEALKRAEMSYAKAMINLPIAKQKAENGLSQAQFSLANKQRALENLKADQAKMEIKAPADGIVYFGRCQRGKWSAPAGTSSRKMEPESKLPANAVVMTLVDIGQLMIRASVDESSLSSLTPPMRGKARVIAAGNAITPVLLKSISKIPLEDGKFDSQIMLEKLPIETTVMPGMTCKLSFLVYENKQAVMLPKASVFSDDDGVTSYVYLMVDGKPKRTEVTLGKTVGDSVEVADGVAAGDKVAKVKP